MCRKKITKENRNNKNNFEFAKPKTLPIKISRDWLPKICSRCPTSFIRNDNNEFKAISYAKTVFDLQKERSYTQRMKVILSKHNLRRKKSGLVDNFGIITKSLFSRERARKKLQSVQGKEQFLRKDTCDRKIQSLCLSVKQLAPGKVIM